MNAIKLRKDYQEITKDLLITPLISEKDKEQLLIEIESLEK